MRYFKPDEFSCKCGKCGLGFFKMQQEFLGRLDHARHIAGVPFTINSALRCQAYNKSVGGVSDSAHVGGWACAPSPKAGFSISG